MGCFFACFGTSKHRKSKKSSNPILSGVQKHEARKFPEPISKRRLKTPSAPFQNQTKRKIFSRRAPMTWWKAMRRKYQNCRDSDSELEDLELQVKELDDNDIDEDNYEGEAAIKEESSESLFSLSIESRKQVYEAEIDEKEINSPMPKPVVACESKTGELKGNIRDRSQYVDSVLKPVENLSQWKTVKARAAPPVTHHAKENIMQDLNIVPIRLEPSFKPLAHSRKLDADHPKPVDEDTAVDASLSSWLVGLETTPNSRTSTVSVGNSPSEGAKSPRKQEDRPILGAMTVEELKQLSASSSPRRSPRRSPSPDEVPIIGTVGSYWSHTGQTMATAPSSCCQGILSTRGTYIEEKRVKWNSTQFERMLGRALDRGAAEV
ncbi:hypothetical protein CK203_097585 [Vitis vinifera]|uniref:Protein JASON n=1 Tax=Vitis vinifera TaxID=29760 RepID=A0A438CKM6_VITVI|nr:hypothetical protein CK203_097585 [Vitis vinifera]